MKDWLRHWIRKHGGYRVGLGNEWLMDCPFPDCGRPQHLYISDETGAWICHRCGKAGHNVKRLLIEIEGPSWFKNAKLRLLLGEEEPEPEKLHTGPIDVSLPSEFIPVYRGGKWSYPTYLTQRRIERETARRLNLGYCRKGEFANRIILPVCCPLGKSFTSRMVHDHTEIRYKAGPDAGKLLFGWESLERYSSDVILVEGPFDAIRVIQAGHPSVAVMGKSLSRNKLLELNKLKRNIIVMLDEEAFGESIKMAQMLGARVALSKGDPDDMDEQDINRSITAAMEVDQGWIEMLRRRTQALINR